MLTAEMSPREGAIAAQWLKLDTVLPCHYNDPGDPDVAAFEEHLEALKRSGKTVPRSLVLAPGDWIEIPAGGGTASRLVEVTQA